MKANDKLRIKRERALAQIEDRIRTNQRSFERAIHKGDTARVELCNHLLKQAEAERAIVLARIASGEGKARKPTRAEETARMIRANYAEQNARRTSEMIMSTVDLNDWSSR